MSETLSFSRQDFLRLLDVLQNMNMQNIYLYHPGFKGMQDVVGEKTPLPLPVPENSGGEATVQSKRKQHQLSDETLLAFAKEYAAGENNDLLMQKYNIGRGSFYHMLTLARVKFGSEVCPRRPRGGPRRGRAARFMGHKNRDKNPPLARSLPPRAARKKEVIEYARLNGIYLVEIEGDLRLNGRTITDAELLHTANGFRLKAGLPPFFLAHGSAA